MKAIQDTEYAMKRPVQPGHTANSVPCVAPFSLHTTNMNAIPSYPAFDREPARPTAAADPSLPAVSPNPIGDSPRPPEGAVGRAGLRSINTNPDADAGSDPGPEAGFNLPAARALVQWSRAAYEIPGDVRDPRTDTHVLVRDCGPGIVVAFRGTASVRDFITDAEAWRARLADCKLHYGFYRALETVRAEVSKRILALALPNSSGPPANGTTQGRAGHSVPAPPSGGTKPAANTSTSEEQDGSASDSPVSAFSIQHLAFSHPRPLYITGHSLGGALAMLFAYRWSNPTIPIAGIYTFGQPRVGDAKFRRRYDVLLGARTFRVVNEEDIVPRVPGLLLGYRHAGQEVFFSVECGIPPEPSLVVEALVRRPEPLPRLPH
jgi:Lipase (class 3)